MSFAFHVALVLLVPPVVTFALCAWLKTPWTLVALLYILVPLVASVAMALAIPERSYSVASSSFIHAVLGIYIMAVFLFGSLPTFVGAWARFFVVKALSEAGIARLRLLIGGIVFGALLGAVLLAAMAPTNKIGPPGDVYHALMILLFTGAVSGGFAGLLVVTYSFPAHEETNHPGKTPGRLSTAA